MDLGEKTLAEEAPQAGRSPAPQVLLEEDRHWWFSTRTHALVTLLDRFLPPHNWERRVLDVGCGAGNMFHHLSRYGKVEGLDNNPRPLEIARQRGYEVQLGSADAMDYGEDQFDLVAALDIVEHVNDDAGVVRECCRVCKPGGFFLATVPAFRWLWSHNDVINNHKRRYTRDEFSALMQRAGLAPRRVTYHYFAIFPAAAGLLLLRKALGKNPQLAAPTTDEEAYQVEMEPASPLVNTVLGAVGRLEAWALRGINFPAGTSILAIGQKE